MTRMIAPALLGAALSVACVATAAAQTAAKTADPALVEKYIASTFGKAPAEWQDRIKPDETLQACNKFRNEVPPAEAAKVTARETARIVYPSDGKLLGSWKEGKKVADNGRGNQFSDAPGMANGGNCYACHQMDAAELSYGTIGPSLINYGKERKYDPAEIKRAWAKIYDSQSQVACSNMPRFGANKVLTEAQIKDIVAFLFDPESPVNK